mgnify:CR=1 FL=1
MERIVDSVLAERSVHETAEAVAEVTQHDGILVVTTAACQGFDLGTAGLVIHYDLPLNDTMMAVRMGRVNRIGSPARLVRVVSFVDGLSNPPEGITRE